MGGRIEASRVVEEACLELGVSLANLVALTSFWIHPRALIGADGPRYPKIRRANLGLRVDGAQVERVGDEIDGIKLDSNNYANRAFKDGLGVDPRQFVGFHVCHIWPGTAYDERCFTHLANLVGIPAELASLTDYHPHIVACLKYRAWELYRWKPAKEVAPVKPEGYPTRWRDPFRAEPASPGNARQAPGHGSGDAIAGAPSVVSVVVPRAPRPSSSQLPTDQVDPMLLAAFYLSKFGHKSLRLGNQGETIDRLAAGLRVNRSSLKHRRDTFDSHTDSGRQGWKVSLTPALSMVMRRLDPLNEPELRDLVLRAMS